MSAGLVGAEAGAGRIARPIPPGPATDSPDDRAIPTGRWGTAGPSIA